MMASVATVIVVPTNERETEWERRKEKKINKIKERKGTKGAIVIEIGPSLLIVMVFSFPNYSKVPKPCLGSTPK